jgi:hypothetical protein
MQSHQPCHTIRLGDAWEPPAAVAGGVRLLRHFGRPSGLEVADRVILVFISPAVPAAVAVNGASLPPLVAGAVRWEHDITALLRDRNTLALAVEPAVLGGTATVDSDAVRGRPPSVIGGVAIEILAGR